MIRRYSLPKFVFINLPTNRVYRLKESFLSYVIPAATPFDLFFYKFCTHTTITLFSTLVNIALYKDDFFSPRTTCLCLPLFVPGQRGNTVTFSIIYGSL